LPSWAEAYATQVHRVVAVALPSVVAFDLSIVGQVFGHDEASDAYSFEICAENPGFVSSTTGFGLNVARGLESLADADTVVVPGYLPLAVPGAAVQEALRDAHRRGARIASVCVGAFALGHAGLLDGLSATTHWQHAEEFQQRFPAVHLVPDVLYVDQGRVLTSAGITAGIDLCLHMYRLDQGAAAASDVARRMVVASHRPGGQAQFSRRPISETHRGLFDTCQWAIGEMHRPLTVNHLARHAAVGVRTFARMFSAEIGLPPMRWLNGQRVLEAERLLEATDLSVDEIAERCGLGSAVSLRRHLLRHAGVTPTAYRKTFRTSPSSS
jgi:transcriptional regulator GlxA family with amidase domain